ncbi:MAG: enoyl-CoA hydratase/isomerase family protein [Acidobacteriota bacterium]|nr:enoyl-CoA hydratase/isomerase family protein [Acidobacteriota bacterium]
MPEEGAVAASVDAGIGTVEFHHPKGNSLPGSLLRRIAENVTKLGGDDDARVIVLRSRGERAFCAGASFDELLAIDGLPRGKEFFMGFARLMLAMRNAPKFVVTRVQGKAVGGGVGVVSASDYALAHDSASIKLSELALGIGPFVIGPAVERKIGKAGFTTLAIDADWRDARWAERCGLYTRLYDSHEDLDRSVAETAERLAGFSPEAMAELKRVAWEGTGHWHELLEARAEISGQLVLSAHTRRALENM